MGVVRIVGKKVVPPLGIKKYNEKNNIEKSKSTFVHFAGKKVIIFGP